MQRTDQAGFLAFAAADKAVLVEIRLQHWSMVAGTELFMLVGAAVAEGKITDAGGEARRVADVGAPASVLGFVAQGIAIAVLTELIGLAGRATQWRHGAQTVEHQAVGLGQPEIGLEVHQWVVLGLEGIAGSVGIDAHLARRPLRHCTAGVTDDSRGHHLAELAIGVAITQLQRLLRGRLEGHLEQRRFAVAGGVEDFVAGLEDLGRAVLLLGAGDILVGRRVPAPDILEHLVFLETLLAGVVVAALTMGVSGDHVQVFAGTGEGQAARVTVEISQAVAAMARLGVVLAGTLAAVVGDIAFEADADSFTLFQDIGRLQGLHLDDATDGARSVGVEAGALVDGYFADQVGVDIAALLHAAVAAIGVDGLLAAIDGHRDPALALDAPDVHIQGTAVAVVTDLHARHALEHVADRTATKAVEGLRGDERRRACGAVNSRRIAVESAGLATLDGHRAEQLRVVQVVSHCIVARLARSAAAQDQAALIIDRPVYRCVAEQQA